MSRYCLDLPHWTGIFGQWLFDWQTLVGGVLALGAAYWAGRGLNKQIKQAQQFKDEDIARQHAAARTVLPIALSAIGEIAVLVAERVATAIDELDEPEFDVAVDHFDAGRHEQIEFPKVSISTDVIGAVGRFVETLKDEVNVRHVAELLSSLQILVSRYNDFNFRHAAPIEGLYGLLIDAAKVRALTDAMFNYGRFVDESRFGIVGQVENSAGWDAILRAATGLVFLRPRLDRYCTALRKRVDSYKGNSVSPWNEKFEF